MKYVEKAIKKKDSMQLLTGKPVYMDDIIPDNCLSVKLLHSPYANAMIKSIDTSEAKSIDGVEAVYTWEDIPAGTKRYTSEELPYPELCPYDRLILDRHLRFVGDVAAIVAAVDDKTAEMAVKLIKVDYEVLEPVLDFTKAKDNKVIIHPEDDWAQATDSAGADKNRNLVAHMVTDLGKDIDEAESGCDVFVENIFHTKQNQQTAMETFRTCCSIDAYGRLNVVSSTQAVYYGRRCLAAALNIPVRLVRMSKARIGGGFGSKGSLVSEVYPAFVTWMTKKPSKIIYTRKESLTISSPRHEMQIRVRLGAAKDGRIKSMRLETLSNTGAYGEHGPKTTIFPTSACTGDLAHLEGYHIESDVVYTNLISSGAYRGYGLTQFTFAIESCINELAHKLDMDPFDLHELNAPKEGMTILSLNNKIESCALDRCLKRVRTMIDWDSKYPCRRIDEHTVRTVGMAMCPQGSGIPDMSVCGATLRMGDEASFILTTGAGEMGQGCDTTLAQIAAEVLKCDVDNIVVFSGDTDATPYDGGSYASCNAYIGGAAVKKAAEKMVEKFKQCLAEKCGCDISNIEFDGTKVSDPVSGEEMTILDMATRAVSGYMRFETSASHTSSDNPSPYLATAVELEIDTQTGEIKVIEIDSAVDCGTPININVCRGQIEGEIVQGLGMALTENVTISDSGHVLEDSFMNYRIPSRLDVGANNVVIESSYEPSGAFGVKSIGEVGINTAGPAIAEAVYNAIGVRFKELPILPEHIAMRRQQAAGICSSPLQPASHD